MTKEARMCSEESRHNLQKKYMDDFWRFLWNIGYQIKDIWKCFPTEGHMHQSELNRRSYDELKFVHRFAESEVSGRCGASK